MFRPRRFLWWALAMPMLLAARSEASEICPPRTSAYEKCPNGFRQSWPVPPLPSYIETDTVVDPLDDGRWEYHWCLKSSVPVDNEIFFIWPDLRWTGGSTACGGFWGLNLQSPSPPSDLQSTASVGEDLMEIQPQIQIPADRVPIWQRVYEYITSIFASLSVDKSGETFIAVGLTIRSTATPVIEGGQVATRYEVEFEDHLSDGVSPIQFYFDSDLA
jgi:hypothetical protein